MLELEVRARRGGGGQVRLFCRQVAGKSTRVCVCVRERLFSRIRVSTGVWRDNVRVQFALPLSGSCRAFICKSITGKNRRTINFYTDFRCYVRGMFVHGVRRTSHDANASGNFRRALFGLCN